jgi:hypothetical protein
MEWGQPMEWLSFELLRSSLLTRALSFPQLSCTSAKPVKCISVYLPTRITHVSIDTSSKLLLSLPPKLGSNSDYMFSLLGSIVRAKNSKAEKQGYSPSISIYTPHMIAHKTLSSRHKSGYSLSVRFRKRLTHVSPVWYQLRRTTVGEGRQQCL